MAGNHAALYRRVTIEAEDAAPDESLLARFAVDRDENAFAELVRRHGPMVLGVCKRTVGHHQDAEDAFQATFLVLARKAGRIGRPSLLGNWLYGVAIRVAGKARRRAARRIDRERTGVAMPDPPTRPTPQSDDLPSVIDAELERLPAHYRDAMLLCDVQGIPRPEAAARLGVPDGTLSSRLSNGRKKLAERLAKLGVALPAVGTFFVVLPDALARRTVATALGWSAGATVPYSILELTRTGGSAMRYAIGASILTTAGLVAGATAGWPLDKKVDPQGPPAVVAKAEEAKPGKAEGIAELKPRRLKIVELGYEAKGMVWSSDGRYVAVSGPNTCSVIDTKTFTQAGTTELGHRVIGFAPGTPMLVTRKWESGRINGVNQLVFWKISDRLEPGPGSSGRGGGRGGGDPSGVGFPEGQFWLIVDHRVEISDEQAEWIHLLPDGKTYLSLHIVQLRPDGGPVNPSIEKTTYSIRVNDLADGTERREIPLDISFLLAVAPTPDGTKVIVLSGTPKTYRMQCNAVVDGKLLWKQDFTKDNQQAMPDPGSRGSYRYAGVTVDSKQTAFTLGYRNDQQGGGQQGGGWAGGGGRGSSIVQSELNLVNTADGEPSPVPIKLLTDGEITPGGFTADGRLFVASSSSPSPGRRLVLIWDTQTGKVVKQWNGTATTSFAPDRSMLAILESFSINDENGKVVFKSSLGFWDCSAPTK